MMMITSQQSSLPLRKLQIRASIVFPRPATGSRNPRPPETIAHLLPRHGIFVSHDGLRRIQVGRAEHDPQVPKQSSWLSSATTLDGILRLQGGCGVKTGAEPKAEPKGSGPKGVAGKG